MVFWQTCRICFEFLNIRNLQRCIPSKVTFQSFFFHFERLVSSRGLGSSSVISVYNAEIPINERTNYFNRSFCRYMQAWKRWVCIDSDIGRACMKIHEGLLVAFWYKNAQNTPKYGWTVKGIPLLSMCQMCANSHKKNRMTHPYG